MKESAGTVHREPLCEPYESRTILAAALCLAVDRPHQKQSGRRSARFTD
jgi:hypothetical protein